MQPASGKDRAYKPMVKSPGAQRESEGVVVPAISVQHNAPGGKGPCFDQAGGEGKREGMAGVSRSNLPGGREPAVAGDSAAAGSMGRPNPVKVQELQRKLWAAAKQSEGRRFHALYDRVHRGDVLWEAWRRVCANRGSAGVDRITLAYVREQYGVERLLGELQADLRTGCYRPAPARREVVAARRVDGHQVRGGVELRVESLLVEVTGSHFHPAVPGTSWRNTSSSARCRFRRPRPGR